MLERKGTAERRVTKRKKKTDENTVKLLEATGASQKDEGPKRHYLDKWMPAQAALEKTQEERPGERILKQASKTHKQRVGDFHTRTRTHSRGITTSPKSAGRSSPRPRARSRDPPRLVSGPCHILSPTLSRLALRLWVSKPCVLVLELD